MSNLGLSAKYVTIYRPVKGRNEMEKTEFEDKYVKLEDLTQAKERWDHDIAKNGHLLGDMQFNIITGDIFMVYNVVKNAINKGNNNEKEIPVHVVCVDATICLSSISHSW